MWDFGKEVLFTIQIVRKRPDASHYGTNELVEVAEMSSPKRGLLAVPTTAILYAWRRILTILLNDILATMEVVQDPALQRSA